MSTHQHHIKLRIKSPPKNQQIPCLGSQLLSPGHDFYAAPKLSPDGTQLAYLSWCHPSMPWDSTQLTLAQLGTDGMVNSQEGGRGFGN